jgi:PAS domain S-box-containing protein
MKEHTILVVDDNQLLLKLSRDIFFIAGYTVVTATDGEEALKILGSEKVDLVVTDILMPNVDGYLLCYKIRTNTNFKDLPVIIYTATYTSASDEALAMEIGADKFIRKPAPMGILLKEAEMLLSSGKAVHKIPTKPVSADARRQYNEGLVNKLENKNIQLEQTLEKLALSEGRLKQAQAIATMGSWEVDLVNNTESWSDELFNLFGLKKDEIVLTTETFLSFVHPDDFSFAKRNVDQAFETRTESSFEFRFVKRDDSLRYGFCKYRFEFDKDKNPLRLYGIIQDVTEKKHAEQALQSAHSRLLFHIENTPLGFIEWDSELRVKSWSKRAEEIFGWTEKEFIELNKTGYSQVFKEDLPSVTLVAGQLIRGEVSRDKVQNRNYRKDGKVIWCEWFNSALKDKDGKVITIMSLVQDVSERKVMEQILQEFNDRYEILSKATNDAIWDWDIQHDFELWNHGIETIFGYTERETHSSREWWKQKIHPEDFERVDGEIQRAFKNKQLNWSSQYRYRCADGSYKNVLDRAYIIYVEDKPVRMIGAMQDITEVYQYRQSLEKMVEKRTTDLNEALTKQKELNELKSKFVSIASHEFRTPLSSISFAAESVRNYFHQLSAEEIKRKLIKIEELASHMTNLLEDILTIGKSEAGKIKVKRVSIDLKEFIESLIDEVNVPGKNKHPIIFNFNSREKISADDKLLRNIVLNLLTNAAKFSNDEKEVFITVAEREDNLVIEVKDSGIGIDQNELESVFEAFQRGSNASAVQGTGLGLSILKKSVEMMGGTVKVESKLGQGSCFTVSIPV